MKNKLHDILDPKVKFEVLESSEVDGEHVLAKVKGVFFCPNGKSRNGRYYPKDLWENVLADHQVKEKIKTRQMYGTVGHETKIDDKAILEGLVSHIITDMRIDENDKGIGEALILNTPAGKTLNTILRAGGQMYVSTRANGTLKGKHEGLPVVDKDTYEFETVDFVCRPGFLEANPTIQEEFNDLINNGVNEKEISMNEQLVKVITDENADLKKKVGELTDEVSSLVESAKEVNEENQHLKGELGKLEEANKIVENFSKLGTVEEINEKFEKLVESEKLIEAYNELGDSPDEIKEALEIGESVMLELKDLGTTEEIEEALEKSINFKEEIDALGSIDDIKAVIEKLDGIAKDRKKEIREKEEKELSEELNLTTDKVSTLLEKYSADDIRELYKNIKSEFNEDDSNHYRKRFNENKTDNHNSGKLYESKILSKSYAERIVD